VKGLQVEVEGLIKSISSDFLNVQHIKETAPKSIDLMLSHSYTTIQPMSNNTWLPLNQVYIGIAATAIACAHPVLRVIQDVHRLQQPRPQALPSFWGKTLVGAGHVTGYNSHYVQQFRNDCKNFLIGSVIQIQKRFDSDTGLSRMVECILLLDQWFYHRKPVIESRHHYLILWGTFNI
jgi:hypothetical protein